MKKLLLRLLGDRRGVAAIEFGFVAPVLFTIVLGGLEYGRMFYVRQGLEGVVEAAARYYVLNPTNTWSSVQTYAQGLPMFGGSAAQISFTHPDTNPCNSNASVTCTMITGTYNFSFVINFLGIGGTRALTASARAIRKTS